MNWSDCSKHRQTIEVDGIEESYDGEIIESVHGGHTEFTVSQVEVDTDDLDESGKPYRRWLEYGYCVSGSAPTPEKARKIVEGTLRVLVPEVF